MKDNAMKPFQSFLAVALLGAALAASAQSFGEVASATLDAVRESREQSTAPENIRAIFAKAREAEADGNVNFCGFYVGMSRTDAGALVAHYALEDAAGVLFGDPIVYSIHFSLKDVRRITKGGNSYEELCQAVANRVGSMRGKSNWKGDSREEWYEYKTIDGVRVTMAETPLPNAGVGGGFVMKDITGSIRAEEERKAREALRKAQEAREAAERKAQEAREAAERKAQEAREAAERKAKEEARQAALAWKGKTKTVPVSDSVAIKIRSIPGTLWFGQYEVKQAEWKAVMGKNPSRFKNPDNPVENVSWNECQIFLKKLNELPSVKRSGMTFRLPTEEEWELACRAGATGDYCLLAAGMEITEETLGEVAWFKDNSDKKSHSVESKTPNAWGLYDMHGNVWEWTSTPDGENRVLRGGCWLCSAKSCEASLQCSRSPSLRYYDLGFRLCATGRAD